VETDLEALRVVDSERGPGIAVARLAHRSRIDEIGEALFDLQQVDGAGKEPAGDLISMLGVDDGEMGVAEKRQGERKVFKRFDRVIFPEDVEILVEGGAVADFDFVDRQRTLREAGEEFQVFLENPGLGPLDRGRGDGIERLHRVLAGDRLVVVPPDDGERLERLDLLDGFVGRGPVADKIAEANVLVDPVTLGVFQDGGQGFEVAVDVAEDQGAHAASPRPRSNEA
jgi:hypothetical protein